ncbi:MAG: DUF192 domain-containing protein [Phycisphaerae bacterium]
MKHRNKTILFLGLPVLLGALAYGAWRLWPTEPPTVTINGHTFQVELALTEPQRRTGLMGRTELAEDRGMLFVFGRAQPLSFYMKNCEIPLDVAFIDASKRIVKIHTMQVEWDRVGRRNYHSGADVQYALEVYGGVLEKLGIKEGDRVIFSDGVPPPAKADP